ncbi:MFS transporter [Methanoregula sp. UBA64]|jgi:MFS family permease|uniref:MFS transporter n=1 Tax=Methanoregula sp. UBA64 TaxID=1915554 RepID=UPI0025D3B7CD|nr:MFS transporter [Methanoregula sp. UBA64]
MNFPGWSGRFAFTPERRMMYYLSLLGFFAIFSTTISKNPVLPLFSNAIGADSAVIGLIAAFSPLAGILFSFPVGVISDHIGRRRLLVLSGAVFLIAPVLYLFITEPVWLIPVRFFHGTATAILGPVISAVIAERFPDTKGEMLGQYSSATLIGRTLAPLAGGAIISYFILYPGLVPYRAVYIVAFLAAVPVFIMTLLYKEEKSLPLNTLPFSAFRESFVTFFANRRLRGTALADMATYFAFGAVETFLPLYLFGLGIGAYQTGIIFAVQVVVIAATKPFFGRIADRVDKRIQIVLGLAVTGIAAAALTLAGSFAGFLVVSAVFGAGMSLSTVATSAYVADVARKEQLGASMGALSSIMDIGQTAGPVITGIIVTAAGYSAGFGASCVIALLICVLFIVSVRETGRDDKTPAA